jgi:hypothetical protein
VGRIDSLSGAKRPGFVLTSKVMTVHCKTPLTTTHNKLLLFIGSCCKLSFTYKERDITNIWRIFTLFISFEYIIENRSQSQQFSFVILILNSSLLLHFHFISHAHKKIPSNIYIVVKHKHFALNRSMFALKLQK